MPATIRSLRYRSAPSAVAADLLVGLTSARQTHGRMSGRRVESHAGKLRTYAPLGPYAKRRSVAMPLVRVLQVFRIDAE